MARREDLPINALESAYELGPWKSVELLPGGKSEHYRILAGSGEYALRCSRDSKTPADMCFEHELITHLRKNGFPAPVVVPSVSGDTCAAVNGRLYSISVFVRGSGYQAGNARHIREVARTLARYHQIVASFQPTSTPPQEPFLNEILRERLAGMPSSEAISGFVDVHGASVRVQALLESLSYVVQKAGEILDRLDRLYPELPLLTIHGGCRRGSALFSGEELITMLDFDSARYEARVVDLAIAFHDLGKVWGDPGSPEFKVPLDLRIVSEFLDAYLEITPLEEAEIEALPDFLAARPLKRALGKYRSMIEEGIVSEGHVRKAAQEVSRVRWLETHQKEMRTMLAVGPRQEIS